MSRLNGFAEYSPRAARLILGITAAFVAFCVAVTLSPLASGYADAPPRGPSDVDLYRAEIARIHAGENYYAAANLELRARGYPTGSVFNWRTPSTIWLLGVLPDIAWGKGILCGLALLALVWSFDLVARERDKRAACLAGLLLTGAFLPCVIGDLCVMPVVWAGVLVLLSLLALARGNVMLGVFFGTAAAIVRDLAVPYLVLNLAYAAVHRRWKEAAGWLLGLLAFGLYFAWHAGQVAAWIKPGDTVHEGGWVRFGGAGFVLSTVQMNVFLLLSPQWVAAIYFPLALLGFVGWQSPRGERSGLVIALFVLLFAVVGRPINQYWGSLLAPLLCLGAAQAPRALSELWRAAKFGAINVSFCGTHPRPPLPGDVRQSG